MRRLRVSRVVVVFGVLILLGGLSPSAGADDGAAELGGESAATAMSGRAFNDVPPSHPFVGPITWMADQGISTGFGDGTFQPTAAVSRQAMAAFMFRLAGEPAGNWLDSAAAFSDVGLSHPFAESIGWMAAEGISQGFGDGTFRPGAAVSRQAMAAFMFRLDGEPAGNWAATGAGQFSDVGGAHPFAQSIGWMALEGISEGFGDGTFRPGAPVSRQAMAAFMQRFADTDRIVAAGSIHTCGAASGATWCWGNNQNGLLGGGPGQGTSVPRRTTGLASGVTHLASFTNHTCAIADGDVWCWGANGAGQLGTGATSPSINSPVQVAGLPGPATDVTVGASHSCALVGGTAYCWGDNQHGKLGTGDTDPRLTPTVPTGLGSNVTSISAGSTHTCAVVSGAARCWGSNGSDQLGTGTAGVQVPTQVTGLTSGVEAVATGSAYSCAIVTGGLRCWGFNGDGQLGDGTTTQRAAPVQVVGLTSGVTEVDTGADHTCAVQNGSLLCWGDNERGQLGRGNTAESLVPVAVVGLPANARSVAAGDRITCVSTGRVVWCWGIAGSKLGLGLGGTDRLVPERVRFG